LARGPPEECVKKSLSDVVRTFRLRIKLRRTAVALAKAVRSARHGRPKGLHYSDFFHRLFRQTSGRNGSSGLRGVRLVAVVPRFALFILLACIGVALAPSGPQVTFSDATARAGITFKHTSGAFGKKYLPETLGSGCVFLDVDGDGWQDLLLVNSTNWPGHGSKAYPALYRNNRDGTFSDITRGSGLDVELYGIGAAAADFDNDGRVDVYITGLGANRLFRNLGGGRFADVTTSAGVGDKGFATSAVWFDYDNDGKLDLFVAHYVEWSVDKDLT